MKHFHLAVGPRAR